MILNVPEINKTYFLKTSFLKLIQYDYRKIDVFTGNKAPWRN